MASSARSIGAPVARRSRLLPRTRIDTSRANRRIEHRDHAERLRPSDRATQTYRHTPLWNPETVNRGFETPLARRIARCRAVGTQYRDRAILAGLFHPDEFPSPRRQQERPPLDPCGHSGNPRRQGEVHLGPKDLLGNSADGTEINRVVAGRHNAPPTSRRCVHQLEELRQVIHEHRVATTQITQPGVSLSTT